MLLISTPLISSNQWSLEFNAALGTAIQGFITVVVLNTVRVILIHLQDTTYNARDVCSVPQGPTPSI